MLSVSIDDIAKVNNDYFVYFTYPSYDTVLNFKLKCSKEQLDEFVKDKNKSEPFDNINYIILGKVNRSFKAKLNLTSDVIDNTSDIVSNSDNILIIEGELVKAISHESIK